MRRIANARIVLALLIIVLPAIASAHALPVDSSPESSAILTSVPNAVTITFSEHIDQSASDIVVTGPDGRSVASGPATVGRSDAHVFSVPITGDGDGTYIVTWSSVSADDGHFTKGSFPFAVGKGQTISASAASQDTEIVELSTTPEAITSGVELAGHGILWAVLLLFIFAIRPLLRSDAYESEAPLLRRGYGALLSLGAILAIGGGVAQVVIKSQQLAQLRELALSPALHIYLGTDAGFATVVRIAAAAVILAIYWIARGRITRALRITLWEGAIFIALLVFAFYRAKISHATSNPFHPHLSIVVNFLHVIEKDVWAGIAGILFMLALIPRMRRFLAALIPRAFAMIAIDFALVAVTASYIIWLHLKSFSNLFTTQWGTTLLQLLIPAVLVVAMRTYHVVARLRLKQLFERLLPITLGLEFAFALLVVYCSSVVIITSPPLSAPPHALTARDQGVSISIARAPYEDGMVELDVAGSHSLALPVVTASQDGAEALSLTLTKHSNESYVFPAAFLAGPGPFAISVTVAQTGAYDAHASFTLTRDDLTPLPEGTRPLDLFTISMIAIALLALVYGIVLYRLSVGEVQGEHAASLSRRTQAAGIGAFIVSFTICAAVIVMLGVSPLSNPFRAQCVGDGNEWHIMLPSVAGQPTSQTPAEGCMWGMGNYMYMIPDYREYLYDSTLGDAMGTLAVAPARPIAGQPVTLTVSLKNADGTPATLFVDMDKIMHVVIVSKDESVYAHIHPDDLHPLTQKEIDSSTYTLTYTFPKAGDYLVMVDYAHGLTLESQQFTVHVSGSPQQAAQVVQYPTSGVFGGYDVSVKYEMPIARQVETLYYTITKDGKPVTLVPYLEAAMHVTVVDNDFSWHLHVHGEVHPPGAPLPPIIVKNGQVLHSMALMTVPPVMDTGAMQVESHFIFPKPGLYTVWGQFQTQSGDLVASAFTVRVEQ